MTADAARSNPGAPERGPRDCALLAAQLPATDVAAEADRDTRLAALQVKIRAPPRTAAAPGPARRLAAATPKAADTSLLEELPLAGDILPSLTPQLKAEMLAAFGIEIL